MDRWQRKFSHSLVGGALYPGAGGYRWSKSDSVIGRSDESHPVGLQDVMPTLLDITGNPRRHYRAQCLAFAA